MSKKAQLAFRQATGIDPYPKPVISRTSSQAALTAENPLLNPPTIAFAYPLTQAPSTSQVEDIDEEIPDVPPLEQETFQDSLEPEPEYPEFLRLVTTYLDINDEIYDTD